MAYIDYSNNWVLDQFLTFLQANQLGANDEHLYDTLAVEHNINTSTVDGTHKANSITGSMINTTPVSTGSQTLDNGQTWTPTAGVYQVVINTTNSNVEYYFEIYVSGSWRIGHAYGTGGDTSTFTSSVLFCDGTNMRIYNSSNSTIIIYYQKF